MVVEIQVVPSGESLGCGRFVEQGSTADGDSAGLAAVNPAIGSFQGFLYICHLYSVCPAELGCPSSSCKYPNKE